MQIQNKKTFRFVKQRGTFRKKKRTLNRTCWFFQKKTDVFLWSRKQNESFYWKIGNVSLRKNTVVLKIYFRSGGLPCPWQWTWFHISTF